MRLCYGKIIYTLSYATNEAENGYHIIRLIIVFSMVSIYIRSDPAVVNHSGRTSHSVPIRLPQRRGERTPFCELIAAASRQPDRGVSFLDTYPTQLYLWRGTKHRILDYWGIFITL